MSRKFHLIALAVVTAAIAAPIGQAGVDPLAQSVLRGAGLSASQVKVWTTGYCSYQVKPASCSLTPAQARLASQRLAQSMGGPRPTSAEAITPAIAQAKAVDPLAISMLRARWSASRIYDWTQGACSYQVKPASCYLTPAQARLAPQRLAESMGGPRPTSISALEVSRPSGFDWGDALIGAAVTAGIFLLGGAGALLLHRRRELTHP